MTSKIIQHRAGSRVESQTRILQAGKDTDVDYMFELDGIEVNCDEECTDIYWKPSAESPAFGTVFVQKHYREILEKNNADIFTADTFEWNTVENAFNLVPSIFKDNVVKASHFDFTKDKKAPTTCPSVAGKGIINEYDTVPCLRLKKWPSIASTWNQRGPVLEKFVINSKWKDTIVNTVPLFLVPTGNPLSSNTDKEFRLSFSMAEISCFDRLTQKMRTNYGIAKYVYQQLFPEANCNLLSSYHIKTIFLHMVEDLSEEKWEDMTSLNFIRVFFGEIKSSIQKKNISHYFINACNVYPLHKTSGGKEKYYHDKFLNEMHIISKTILELLCSDLEIPNDCPTTLEFAVRNIDQLETSDKMERYIAGYLTRLLSMTTFSLHENYLKGQLNEAFDSVRRVLESYKSDKHVRKIINAINIFVISIGSRDPILIKLVPNQSNCQSLSEIAHAAFELYQTKQYDEVETVIQRLDLHKCKPSEIGISITKYHKSYELDSPIHFVIHELEKRYDSCPRFYIDPLLMINHLKVQLELRKLGNMSRSESSRLQQYMKEMEILITQLSDRHPYIGKLSYRFAAVYLMHGYRKQFNELGMTVSLSIPDTFGLDSFNQRKSATNFDLR